MRDIDNMRAEAEVEIARAKYYREKAWSDIFSAIGLALVICAGLTCLIFGLVFVVRWVSSQ